MRTEHDKELVAKFRIRENQLTFLVIDWGGGGEKEVNPFTDYFFFYSLGAAVLIPHVHKSSLQRCEDTHPGGCCGTSRGRSWRQWQDQSCETWLPWIGSTGRPRRSLVAEPSPLILKQKYTIYELCPWYLNLHTQSVNLSPPHPTHPSQLKRAHNLLTFILQTLQLAKTNCEPSLLNTKRHRQSLILSLWHWNTHANCGLSPPKKKKKNSGTGTLRHILWIFPLILEHIHAVSELSLPILKLMDKICELSPKHVFFVLF